MSLVIAQEPLTDQLIEEATPMMIEHWRELAKNPDIIYNPNFNAYFDLQKGNALVVLTARMNGKLVGYVAFAVFPNMHYQDSLQAQQDVLFVQSDTRKSMLGVGLGLIRMSEEVLRERGVQVVQHHIKVYKDFSPMLERLGYEFVEKIYQKRLD